MIRFNRERNDDPQILYHICRALSRREAAGNEMINPQSVTPMIQSDIAFCGAVRYNGCNKARLFCPQCRSENGGRNMKKDISHPYLLLISGVLLTIIGIRMIVFGVSYASPHDYGINAYIDVPTIS